MPGSILHYEKEVPLACTETIPPAFEERYTYSGADLGFRWTPEKTVWRLWAPTAESVKVNLYSGGTAGVQDLLEQIPMRSDVQGTWIAENREI